MKKSRFADEQITSGEIGSRPRTNGKAEPEGVVRLDRVRFAGKQGILVEKALPEQVTRMIGSPELPVPVIFKSK